MKATILLGDVLARLGDLEPDSIDSVVTDPPYEIGFMGKAWDKTGIAYNVGLFAQLLRLLKPGGHLLAFGGARTYHRMACAIEDAGFQIRDQIMWIYGSGFPKSRNLGGGLGTALKPAHEPICVARKPPQGTIGQNVKQYQTGALRIDDCRIETDDSLEGSHKPPSSFRGENSRPFHANYRAGERSAERRYADRGSTDFGATPGPRGGDRRGRWPANVVHDGSQEVREAFPDEAGAAARFPGAERL